MIPAQQQPKITITTTIVRKKTSKGKQINQYAKIKKIGQGPFSKIKLMLDTRDIKDTHYAMKKYNLFILKKKIKMDSKKNGQNKYSTQADEVYKQIQIMKKLNHKNVVRLHEIMQDHEQQKVYLMMDYCKYGDIAEWNHKKLIFVTRWTLKNICKFMKQATLGLQYLHNLSIVHLDIKPSNILIYQQQETNQVLAKIIDFGRSVQLTSSDQKLAGSIGTYHFMPPQMLSQKIVGGYDAKLCDIWSLGVTMFCCVFLKLPFYGENQMKLFQKIQKGQYELPHHLTVQQKRFQPLIAKMISIDWNKRPSLKQVLQRLQDLEKGL